VVFFGLGENYYVVDVNITYPTNLFAKHIIDGSLKNTWGIFQPEGESTKFVLPVVVTFLSLSANSI